MDELTRAWPLFGLRLCIGELELRLPTDAELAALADLAAHGIHAPEEMPFQVPWTRAEPPALQREFVQYHWRMRASSAPEDWVLNLGVFRGAELLGSQGIEAKRFAVRRTVATGSWLGQRYQGRGLGTAMRTAVLALAFEGLGARRAETGAFEDNPASLAVTRRLGYRPNGDTIRDREGCAARELHFVMGLDDWRAVPRPEVVITGLDDCLELLGA